MARKWTAEGLLESARGFQPACVLQAGAELNVFAELAASPGDAGALARRLGCDVRGMTLLLDALTALELLGKDLGGRYTPLPGVAELLTEGRPGNVLAMLRHQSACTRRWAQLAQVVKTGQSADGRPGVLGAAGEQAAFIEAMDNISRPLAEALVAEVCALVRDRPFTRVLDVGGASGTWTMAFLKTAPGVKATLFDLPVVIPMAQKRLTEAGFIDRVRLVPGDFCKDTLPTGCDLAWISAIVHQNSRVQNRELFQKLAAALPSGGRLLIRDMVMEESHTAPVAGALFAVNMLVGTAAGGTFTLGELREDLEASGFSQVKLLRPDPAMHAIVGATR